ncbi:hypothetical protein [Streptomyces sp. NPDC060194]|uniref:hypothetical protein n=1 Tax=Streptomyces sp. NPDC060194 TaxID=3347069 RepID=UPI003662501C
MLWEALGSAMLGLFLSLAALHRFAHRLPDHRLVLATGPAGALFGAFVAHTALGSGHVLPVLVGAVLIGAALLSLLLKPATRRLRRSTSATA